MQPSQWESRRRQAAENDRSVSLSESVVLRWSLTAAAAAATDQNVFYFSQKNIDELLLNIDIGKTKKQERGIIVVIVTSFGPARGWLPGRSGTKWWIDKESCSISVADRPIHFP